MKIHVQPILCKDLKAGDLFSNVGELYWSEKNLLAHEKLGAVGQKVYIRTGTKLTKHQQEERVYKITIDL